MSFLSERRARKKLEALRDSYKPVGKTEFIQLVTEMLGGYPRYFASKLADIVTSVQADEHFLTTPPVLPMECDSIEGTRYEDKLRKLQERSYSSAASVLVVAIREVIDRLPDSLGPENFYIPIWELPILPELVERTVLSFIGDEGKRNYPVYHKLFKERLIEHGLPTKSEEDDLVEVYLKDTPFEPLYSVPVVFDIPKESYFEHIWVCGGTGAGKTSWLSQLILKHIRDPEKPSIVVVDSQGSLIPKLATLADIQDRLIVIDPVAPPAINIFKEGTTDTFDYLFSSIIGAALTPKQSVFFRFITRLMMKVPDASMRDLLQMMRDPSPYQEYIERLTETQREFFKTDFTTNTYKDTKEQVKYRLNAIMENDTLNSLLSSSRDRLHIDEALDSGKVVLVDTSVEKLGKASSQFGKIFIWQVLRAIYNRASQANKHPTFLIVDEAQEYFDQNIDDMLTQARKYRLGCVFAHQYLQQCSPQLLASLRANTGIKMVSGVSAPDARALAQELRTTSDFILSRPQLNFATYIRNAMDTAISFTVRPGLLDNQKHVENVERKYKPLIEDHKKPLPKVAEPTSRDDVDTDASDTW